MATQAENLKRAYDMLVAIATDIENMSDGCAICAANIILSGSGPHDRAVSALAITGLDLKKPYMGDEALGAWVDACEHEPREVYEYAASNLCIVHSAQDTVNEAQTSFAFGGVNDGN